MYVNFKKMGHKHSSLTPEQINDMGCLTHLSPEDIIEFRKEFNKDYPKGRITKDDLKKLYTKTYPSGNPDDVVKELFRVYDMDRNGTVDFREFLAGLGVMARGSADEKLRLAFEIYDLDGSGSISKEEIRSLVQAIYKATSSGKYTRKTAEAVGQALFDILDRNKDNKVSLQEFINGARNDPSVIDLISETHPK